MKWISVKDELPDNYDFVLVARHSKSNCPAVMETMFFNNRFYTFRFREKQEFLNPTHWTLIPEPPEEL
jgi:hypothetical protein